MGFLSAYKHLDNLCRDINGVGVSGYISDMEKKPDGNLKVANWKNDYQKLKQYRHIRNQIAHETYADESNMCTETDAVWVEGFYSRIMTQTDPLALYRKATEQVSVKKKTDNTVNMQNVRESTKSSSNNFSRSYNVGWIVAIIVAIIVVTAFILHKFLLSEVLS